MRVISFLVVILMIPLYLPPVRLFAADPAMTEDSLTAPPAPTTTLEDPLSSSVTSEVPSGAIGGEENPLTKASESSPTPVLYSRSSLSEKPAEPPWFPVGGEALAVPFDTHHGRLNNLSTKPGYSFAHGGSYDEEKNPTGGGYVGLVNNDTVKIEKYLLQENPSPYSWTNLSPDEGHIVFSKHGGIDKGASGREYEFGVYDVVADKLSTVKVTLCCGNAASKILPPYVKDVTVDDQGTLHVFYKISQIIPGTGTGTIHTDLEERVLAVSKDGTVLSDLAFYKGDGTKPAIPTGDFRDLETYVDSQTGKEFLLAFGPPDAPLGAKGTLRIVRVEMERNADGSFKQYGSPETIEIPDIPASYGNIQYVRGSNPPLFYLTHSYDEYTLSSEFSDGHNKVHVVSLEKDENGQCKGLITTAEGGAFAQDPVGDRAIYDAQTGYLLIFSERYLSQPTFPDPYFNLIDTKTGVVLHSGRLAPIFNLFFGLGDDTSLFGLNGFDIDENRNILAQVEIYYSQDPDDPSKVNEEMMGHYWLRGSGSESASDGGAAFLAPTAATIPVRGSLDDFYDFLVTGKLPSTDQPLADFYGNEREEYRKDRKEEWKEYDQELKIHNETYTREDAASRNAATDWNDDYHHRSEGFALEEESNVERAQLDSTASTILDSGARGVWITEMAEAIRARMGDGSNSLHSHAALDLDGSGGIGEGDLKRLVGYSSISYDPARDPVAGVTEIEYDKIKKRLKGALAGPLAKEIQWDDPRYIAAVDANKDGKISAADLAVIYKYLDDERYLTAKEEDFHQGLGKIYREAQQQAQAVESIVNDLKTSIKEAKEDHLPWDVSQIRPSVIQILGALLQKENPKDPNSEFAYDRYHFGSGNMLYLTALSVYMAEGKKGLEDWWIQTFGQEKLLLLNSSGTFSRMFAKCPPETPECFKDPNSNFEVMSKDEKGNEHWFASTHICNDELKVVCHHNSPVKDEMMVWRHDTDFPNSSEKFSSLKELKEQAEKDRTKALEEIRALSQPGNYKHNGTTLAAIQGVMLGKLSALEGKLNAIDADTKELANVKVAVDDLDKLYASQDFQGLEKMTEEIWGLYLEMIQDAKDMMAKTRDWAFKQYGLIYGIEGNLGVLRDEIVPEVQKYQQTMNGFFQQVDSVVKNDPLYVHRFGDVHERLTNRYFSPDSNPEQDGREEKFLGQESWPGSVNEFGPQMPGIRAHYYSFWNPEMIMTAPEMERSVSYKRSGPLVYDQKTGKVITTGDDIPGEFKDVYQQAFVATEAYYVKLAEAILKHLYKPQQTVMKKLTKEILILREKTFREYQQKIANKHKKLTRLYTAIERKLRRMGDVIGNEITKVKNQVERADVLIPHVVIPAALTEARWEKDLAIASLAAECQQDPNEAVCDEKQKTILNAYAAKEELADEIINGKIILDENGNPVIDPLTGKPKRDPMTTLAWDMEEARQYLKGVPRPIAEMVRVLEEAITNPEANPAKNWAVGLERTRLFREYLRGKLMGSVLDHGLNLFLLFVTHDAGPPTGNLMMPVSTAIDPLLMGGMEHSDDYLWRGIQGARYAMDSALKKGEKVAALYKFYEEVQEAYKKLVEDGVRETREAGFGYLSASFTDVLKTSWTEYGVTQKLHLAIEKWFSPHADKKLVSQAGEFSLADFPVPPKFWEQFAFAGGDATYSKLRLTNSPMMGSVTMIEEGASVEAYGEVLKRQLAYAESVGKNWAGLLTGNVGMGMSFLSSSSFPALTALPQIIASWNDTTLHKMTGEKMTGRACFESATSGGGSMSTVSVPGMPAGMTTMMSSMSGCSELGMMFDTPAKTAVFNAGNLKKIDDFVKEMNTNQADNIRKQIKIFEEAHAKYLEETGKAFKAYEAVTTKVSAPEVRLFDPIYLKQSNQYHKDLYTDINEYNRIAKEERAEHMADIEGLHLKREVTLVKKGLDLLVRVVADHAEQRKGNLKNDIKLLQKFAARQAYAISGWEDSRTQKISDEEYAARLTKAETWYKQQLRDSNLLYPAESEKINRAYAGVHNLIYGTKLLDEDRLKSPALDLRGFANELSLVDEGDGYHIKIDESNTRGNVWLKEPDVLTDINGFAHGAGVEFNPGDEKGKRMWLIGGYTSNGELTKSRDTVFSSTDGEHWVQEGDLNLERYGLKGIVDHQVVVFGKYMYVLGGKTDDGKASKRVLRSLNGRDWEETVSLPIPLYDHSAVVANLGNGEKIYVTGGMTLVGSHKGDLALSQKVYSFDGLTTEWKREGSLPDVRAEHATVFYGNRIWSIGGIGNDKVKPDPTGAGVMVETFAENRVFYAQLSKDKPPKLRWTESKMNALPSDSGGFKSGAAVVFKSEIWLAGGTGDGAVYTFKGLGKAWERVGANSPFGVETWDGTSGILRDHTAMVHGGKLFTVGGRVRDKKLWTHTMTSEDEKWARSRFNHSVFRHNGSKRPGIVVKSAGRAAYPAKEYALVYEVDGVSQSVSGDALKKLLVGKTNFVNGENILRITAKNDKGTTTFDFVLELFMPSLSFINDSDKLGMRELIDTAKSLWEGALVLPNRTTWPLEDWNQKVRDWGGRMLREITDNDHRYLLNALAGKSPDLGSDGDSQEKTWRSDTNILALDERFNVRDGFYHTNLPPNPQPGAWPLLEKMTIPLVGALSEQAARIDATGYALHHFLEQDAMDNGFPEVVSFKPIRDWKDLGTAPSYPLDYLGLYVGHVTMKLGGTKYKLVTGRRKAKGKYDTRTIGLKESVQGFPQ